nr:LCP family protein [Oscillatoria sp. FACHB-1406]
MRQTPPSLESESLLSPTVPKRRSRLTLFNILMQKRIWLWSSTFAIAVGISAVSGAAIGLFAPIPKSFAHFVPGSETSADGKVLEHQKLWDFFLRYELDRPVNILVLGIDRVLDAQPGSKEAFDGHSDTMLLLRFDPEKHVLQMLSIPRDTRVLIPGEGMVKINDANFSGGAKRATEVVSETLNDIPIDRYVRITNDAFRELVDLVGGIEVNVPHAMQYRDETQQLNINLAPGRQILNGDRAEQFARFRKDSYGDIGRIQRQQILLKALRERLQSPATLPRLPQAVQMMRQYVDTNLSWEETLALVGFGLKLEKEQIKMVMLPGRFSEKNEFNGVSYWLMSERERDRILRNNFDQPVPGEETTSEKTEASESEQVKPLRARIAIQNTTADPAVAERVLEYLQARDIRNAYISERPAPQVLEQTEIIVQQGDRETAKRLHALLGFGSIEDDSTGDIGSQLTLRVGSDWLPKLEAEPRK